MVPKWSPKWSLAQMDAAPTTLTNPTYRPNQPSSTNTRDKSDLKPAEAFVSESRVLGPLLGTVGIGSVVWGLVARPEFGDLAERSASLVELLSGKSNLECAIEQPVIYQRWHCKYRGSAHLSLQTTHRCTTDQSPRVSIITNPHRPLPPRLPQPTAWAARSSWTS